MSAEAVGPALVGRESETPTIGALAWQRIGTFVLAIVVAIALANFLWALRFGNTFLHPAFFRDNMLSLFPRGLGFQLEDLAIPFKPMAGPDEHRPRFITYGLLLIDHHLRFLLYKWTLVPTTFGVEWPFEFLLASFCLLGLVKNLTSSWVAAFSALAVYLASIGYLSGFTMMFMPGKPLSNVLFLVVLWLASEIDKRLRPDVLLFEQFTFRGAIILALAFLGLFVDEVPIFVFALLPGMFFDRFVPKIPVGRLRRILTNGAIFALPGVLFLGVVVWLVPVISELTWGYRFDYIATLLNRVPGNMAAPDPLGPTGRFTPLTAIYNLWTLFGVFLMPWQIDPFMSSKCGCQSPPKALLVFAFVGGLAVLAWTSREETRTTFRRLMIVSLLFVLFESVLQGRHAPVVDGFYYGSTFSVFVALLVGFAVHTVRQYGHAWYPAAAAACLILVLSEINNFTEINSRTRSANGDLAHQSYAKLFPSNVQIDASLPTTATELWSIWKADSEGKLAEYVGANPISDGAVYLVAELDWGDRCRSSVETNAGGCLLAKGPLD